MKRLLLAVVLLSALFLPPSARAQGGIVYGPNVPAGLTVDHDVLLVGQNVSLDGTVNGNVFILGNQVIVNGTVNGSLVLIAQNASIGGAVSGGTYVAAITLDLPDQAALARDLYALTVSLTSKPASHIGRHLYALGLDAGLNGQIGGELHTVLGPIQLYNGLVRLLGFDELTLELRFEPPAVNPIPSPTGTPQGRYPKVHLVLALQKPLPPFDWSAWAVGILRGWGVLFALGLLVLWRARQPLQDTGAPLRSHPWRTLGLGLLVLVVALNLFVVALLLMALLFALGLGLNALGLWPVSLALWMLSYSALAIALTLLWLFIVYGTKILVSYAFASWLLGLFRMPSTVWADIVALLVGTLIFSLLRSVPYVGWAIGLIVIAAGMGSAWQAYRRPRGMAAVTAVGQLPKPASRKGPRAA